MEFIFSYYYYFFNFFELVDFFRIRFTSFLKILIYEYWFFKCFLNLVLNRFFNARLTKNV